MNNLEYIDILAREYIFTHDEYLFARKIVDLYNINEHDYNSFILYYYNNSPLKKCKYDVSPPDKKLLEII